jgi:flavodoxin
MKSAVIIYWSKTGNTEKVAVAIREGLEAAGSARTSRDAKRPKTWNSSITTWSVSDPLRNEFHLPKPMADYIKTKLSDYRKRGFIKIGPRKFPGRTR